MEAVEESADSSASLSLSNLEERITRAVQVVNQLRSENAELQQQLKSTQDELASIRNERDEAQGLLAEFQKENGDLDEKLKRLSEELDGLRGERKQVKTRIEKLLNQLDLLSAS